MMKAHSSHGLAPVDFMADLTKTNPGFAPGFERFLLLPGMEFGARQQWWGAGGLRPFLHEGVDLCLFRTRDDRFCRVDDTIQVPLSHPGEVAGVITDFLGKTVIVRHEPGPVRNEEAFFSFYGHVKPADDLAAGDVIKAGDVFATIAKVETDKSPIPPHLHVSAAWCRLLPPADILTWSVLNRINRSAFIDPLDLLGISYEMIITETVWPVHGMPGCGDDARAFFKSFPETGGRKNIA
jgi:hypothetical protein